MTGEGGGGVQGGESAVAWGRESRNFKRDGALFWKRMKKVLLVVIYTAVESPVLYVDLLTGWTCCRPSLVAISSEGVAVNDVGLMSRLMRYGYCLSSPAFDCRRQGGPVFKIAHCPSYPMFPRSYQRNSKSPCYTRHT